MSTPPDQMPQRAGQAPTMRLPKRLPLVQQYQSRNQSILKDSRLVNCYAEQNADGTYTVEKRPSLVGALSIPANQAALGFFCFKQWGFWAAGTSPGNAALSIISLDTMTVSSTTAIDLDGDIYSFIVAATSLTNTTVYMANAEAAYLLPYSTIPPALTPITDTNFPTNSGILLCSGAAVLDGTLYVMGQNGLIYGSDIDDPTTWNSLNVIAANADADPTIAIASHLTYVVALKQWTTNFFYDAGNSPGSPLSPVPDSQVPYGCLAGTTVQEIDGNLLWVTTGKNVAPQVGRLNNLSFSTVSTPAIERLLLSGGSANEFRSWTLKTAGHRFYGVTNYVQNYTIVLDLDLNMWYIWMDSTAQNIFPLAFSCSQVESAYPQYILGVHPFEGYMWSIQPDYMVPVDSIFPTGGTWQLDAPTVDIYTPSYDAGTRRPKTLDCMFFNTDKTAGSILQARYNDSDYQTEKWSNFRQIDLSRKRPMLTDNGTFSRRAYHFRHKCPTPLRLNSVDLQMDLGTG